MGWRKGSDGGGRKRPGDAGRGEPPHRPARHEPEGHARPQPKPARSSWRKNKDAGPAETSASSSSTRYYRRTGGFFGFLFGRRLKLWTLLCVFAVLLAGIVWLLLSVPSRVPVVAVAVSAYKDPRIPQNLTALTDIDRIDHLDSDTADFRKVGVPIEKTGGQEFSEAFRRKLKEVTPGGSAFSRKSIIIYISAHGVVNGEGKTCLLLADSDPLDESTWHPLSDVLAAIKEQSGFADATKLLALDCCRIRSDWRLGILDNHFAELLRDEIRNAEIPNLAVLTSAGPGEQAWSAPELGGGTVFGHFLAVGLRGAAARHAYDRRPVLRRIVPKETLSIGELCDFVTSHVSRWVAETRGADQHPQLLTRKSETASLRNTDVAWISHHDPAAHSTAGALRERDDAKSREILAQLKQYWAEHQSRQEQPAWRMFPLHWAEFELRLLRFEELYLDAVSESEALDRARKEVDEALKPLNDPLPPVVFPGSAALAASFPGVSGSEGPGPIEACFAKMVEWHIDETDRRKFAREIGQANLARKLAEDLGAPVDPRVQYWLRPVLRGLDDDRRRAEDHLFVGNPQSLSEAQAIWGKLLGGTEGAGLLQQAQTQGHSIAEGLRQRDEIWSRLWWLARWLHGGPLRGGAVAAEVDEALDKLIAAADRLSQELELIHGGDPPDISESLAEARTAFDSLREEFNKSQKSAQRTREELAELRKSGSFGALCGLMTSPLVTGADRELLREKHDRLVTRLRESRDDLITDWTASPEWPESTEARAARARQIVERLLEIGGSAGGDKDSAEASWQRAEAAIRKALGQTAEMIKTAAAPSEKEIDSDRQSPDPAAAGDEQALKDDLTRRIGLSAADLAGRRRAWFVPRLESAAVRLDRTWQSPSRRLMQFDLAALALWHCDRALDDFWGPVPGSGDGQSYFARSARAFLGATTNDDVVKRDGFFADRRKRLETKLDVREKSTRLATKVEDRSVVFEANVAERKQTVTLADSKGAPAGIAAVFVAEAGGRELDRTKWHQDREHPQVWRQAVPLPAGPSSKPVEFTILKEVTGGARGAHKLEARGLFRGHVSSGADPAASFVAQLRVVRPIEPVAVAAAAPEIRVKGSRHSVTELIFIVDASDSMHENVRGKQGVGILERKWTIAKSAMQTILSELQARQSDWAANDEEWRAGLMVYGHRAAWTEKMNKVYFNKEAPAADREAWAGQGVVPHADVELLVPPARFDEELAKRMVTALSKAEPWGQTPLYYSLREAIKELEKTAKPGVDQPNRHIILVTDGVNNNPRPAQDGADVGPEAVNAALRTFKGRYSAPIHIDVVYFGAVQERDRNDLRSLTRFVEEVSDLAGTRPGEKSEHMHMADSPENLIYSVRSAVERNRLRFRVVRSGASADEGGYLPANSTWTAPAAAVLPDRYAVQIDGTPEAAQEVRLEGGEFLRLLFKKDKLEFEPQPAEKGLLKRITVGLGRGRLNVHPYLPAVGSDDVLFKFGVQYADPARFTPRPSDVWAEVTPMRQDDDGTPRGDEDEPAVFFDRSFLPAQRMPVLQFKFPGWPAQANAARVRLWLRFADERGRSPVEPLRIKYRDALGASSAKDGGVPLADFGVMLRVAESALGNGAVRITVVEQQVDNGNPRDWCRVELSARPDTVTRRYFLGEQRAEHVFEFHEGRKPDAAELEIQATPAARLKDNALQIPADEAEIQPLPVNRKAAAGADPALN